MLVTALPPTEADAAIKTGALPVGPINTRTVSARLGISVASHDIMLDGRPCGRIVREAQGGRGVWVATLTDVEGHRGGLIENGSFAEVQRQVVLKIVEILRRHYPNADWGALTLNATPDEVTAIRDGTQRVLRYAYAARYSGKACPVGRHVIIANFHLRRQYREYLHGRIIKVKKVPREKVVAEDPNLRWSFLDAKSVALIYFDLCPYGSLPAERDEEIHYED